MVTSKSNSISFAFLAGSLLALLFGMVAGNLGALQYIVPGFLSDLLPFHKSRPIHVTLVITWIFTAAIGGVYYYLPQTSGRNLYAPRLTYLHLTLLVLTGLVIIASYLADFFGGREYLEFPPALALPMLMTWIFFMISFFGTLKYNIREWKIYHWMWSTGVLFFFITFGEAYLWTFDFFNRNQIRDVTVQWKAMGSMVGSWNMLVYGTAFYIMEKISGNEKVTTSRQTYFFYFLGLTNLMFNWGHHTYIVPASPWIKNTAYIISMTELILIGNIIWNWKNSLTEAKKNYHFLPYRFLSAADFWIFLNLVLAILISVPAINYYTHGTHITVAHAMGATIGINSMILFASVYFIVFHSFPALSNKVLKRINSGFWITNISLIMFWFSLIGSGLVKASGEASGLGFRLIMTKAMPIFTMFSVAGLGILAGLTIISLPAISLLGSKAIINAKLLLKRGIR